MFILYAIPVGLIIGALLGGRMAGLGRIQFRWAWVALAGFALQVLLFSDPVAARIGAAGPPLYVASTAVVFAAVLRNVAIRGMALVAAGAGANLLAIVANGGYMPANPNAAEAFGRTTQEVYSNSRILDAPALAPLTDVIALPQWLPFTNIVSIGDVLIAAGVVVVIVAAMRDAGSEPATDDAPGGSVRAGNSPI